jgi:hypothetical protein
VGPDCLANVILATRFWNEVDPTEGARRERELCNKDEFWGSLIKNGSSVATIGLDEDADRRLLLKMAQKHKVLLQVQEDMQSENRTGRPQLQARLHLVLQTREDLRTCTRRR